MKTEKRMQSFQKRIYLIGVTITLLFCVILLFTKFHRDYEEAHTTLELEDAESGEHIAGFYDLNDFLTYFKAALENDDVDRYLRGCAIEEKVDSYPFTYLMGKKKTFAYNVAYLPSGSYDEYQPVNSLLITRDFLNQYHSWKSQLEELTGVTDPEYTIKKIGILKQEEQTQTKYLKDVKSRASRWSADYFVELTALVQVGGKYYTFSFTVGRYDQSYKLFKLQAELAGWGSDDYVKTTSLYDFNQSYTDTDVESFSEEMEGYVMDEIPASTKEQDKISDVEQAVLPINYTVIGQKACSSPSRCITDFLKEIIRHNPMKALNYCYAYDDLDHMDEVIDQEGYMALQLSYVYKGLGGLPYARKIAISYSLLGLTSKEVKEKLNPEALHTLSLSYIYQSDYENEYIAVVNYNNTNYKLGFTVMETEEGWMIRSLSADRCGIGLGEAVKIEELE